MERMSAIPRKSSLISPKEYLAGELVSQVKHEYLGGVVHAMSGARAGHNSIALNILTALKNRLRGQKCQPYNSDNKLQVLMPSGQERYYYPDVQVTCEHVSSKALFLDRPVVIAEVLSPSTRRTDEHEKLEAYITIPTLQTYLLVDSNKRQVTVYQRSKQGFERTEFHLEGDCVTLPSLGLELSLSEIYENVVLEPPSDEELTEYGS